MVQRKFRWPCLIGTAALALIGCGDLNRDLYDAVARHDVESVRSLIMAGASLDWRDKYDNDALAVAVQPCDEPMLRVLLKSKAPSMQVSMDRALMTAASGDERRCMVLLVAAGANPNAVRDVDDDSPSVLQFAIAYADDTETISLLLDSGADIDYQNRGGDTALIDAAGRGHLGFVELLLKRGANVRAVNARRENALITAIMSDREVVARRLFAAGADPCSVDVHNQSAIDLARAHNYLWVSELGDCSDPARIEGT